MNTLQAIFEVAVFHKLHKIGNEVKIDFISYMIAFSCYYNNMRKANKDMPECLPLSDTSRHMIVGGIFIVCHLDMPKNLLIEHLERCYGLDYK